jgi:DNA-binding SARP family transcriptional activator
MISLLGPMQVLLNGRQMRPPRSRKALWLLALLTLRPYRPVEREWLAETLWPDMNQSQAFSNLRRILSELRTSLENESRRLQSPNRHTLFLDLADADVDVVAFDLWLYRT